MWLEELSRAETEATILRVLKKIDSDLTIAGDPGALARWEKGWTENLEAYRESHDIESLRPRYMGTDEIIRLNGRYVRASPGFECKWYDSFMQHIVDDYLFDASTIYEFGCGSGFNVATLAKRFPDKKIWGLDWSDASVSIIQELKASGLNVEGHKFDLFDPDDGFKLDARSAVLTVGALEQTGEKFKRFMMYLLRQPIKRVVNIEPIVEWYDASRRFDHLAIMFHEKRGYLKGLPKALKEAERGGIIRIVNQERSNFGSLFIEGYSQNIWEPL